MIAPALLYRRSLKFFVREVFRQLHSGHPPLELSWYMQAMCHALEETYRGDSRRLVINVLRKRLEYPDLKREVIRMWRRWKPDAVLIENASSGMALWAELRMEGPFRPIMWDVAKSKVDRLIGQTGQMEAGKIVLPNEAPWLDDYCHELKTAPNCRYWDQVDSTTQFLEFALSRQGWIEAETDPVTGRRLRINRPSRVRDR